MNTIEQQYVRERISYGTAMQQACDSWEKVEGYLGTIEKNQLVVITYENSNE